MQAPTSAATVDPSSAHVHRLLDLLPAGACLCAADGRITHYSAQAAELWGHRPDLAEESPRWCGALRLFDEDGRPLPHDDLPVAHALREGRAHHGRRLQLERPDGERRHVLSYASPLLDDDGALVGGLALLVDVTDRHRAAQAERDRLRARGEELVALACDIRGGLTPLRQGARDAERRAEAAALDEQLRHITRLVDRVLNLEVDAD
jgi:PAS domain S-box-containing protein